MQLLFVLLSVVGCGYFGLVKRRFDFFSLAFISAVVYFLPGFFGFARSPVTVFTELGEPLPLVQETYVVFCLVLLSIFGASLIYDQLPDLLLPKKLIPRPGLVIYIFLALSLLGFAATVASVGEGLLGNDKAQILESVGRWRILWVTAASLAVVLAFVLRRWWAFGLALTLLLVDLYVGFRYNLALATIAIFVAWLHRQGEGRLAIDRIKILIPGILAGLSFFVYKHLYQPIKIGAWDVLWERMSSWELLERSIVRSEPFITQSILNEVLARKFYLGMEGFSDILYGGLLFAPSVAGRVESVHVTFQENLFPGAPSSLGSNIWAEMWSRGDWSFLLLFLAGFLLVLAFWSMLLRSDDPAIKALALLNGAYWAFYIHRNSMLFQLTLHKRMVLLWILACGLAFLVATVLRARDSLPRRGGFSLVHRFFARRPPA